MGFKISPLKVKSLMMDQLKETQLVSSLLTRPKLKLSDQLSSHPKKDSQVKLSLNTSVSTGPKPGDIMMLTNPDPSQLVTHQCLPDSSLTINNSNSEQVDI